MTKVIVDKAVLEQVIDALNMGLRFRETGLGRPPEQYNPPAIEALQAALNTVISSEQVMESSVEVIECGNLYAKVKLLGGAWGSTSVGDKFYASPPPPAEVPLLTPGEVALMWVAESFDTMSHESCYARGVKRGEQVVRQKTGLK